MTEQFPPGLDLRALHPYLRANVPGVTDATLHARLIAGGRSNLTYLVSQGDACWVIRRPPLGHVLPTAHDMGREYRVLRGLYGSAVPVPQPFHLCADESVIGAPFYVMSYVDGRCIGGLADASELTAAEADLACGALVRTLAAINTVDPAAVGLADLGRPAGYLDRQIGRWWKQWERSRTRELPDVARLRDRLAATLPASGPTGIVHGDYRFDNTLIDRADAGRLLAVLDWEMATLGDPLADIGLLLLYWNEPADRLRATVPVSPGVTAGPGFWDRQRVADAYAKATGYDLGDLTFYVAIGCYKFAVILEGIQARHLAGETVGEGYDGLDSAVPALVELGHRVLDGGVAALSA